MVAYVEWSDVCQHRERQGSGHTGCLGCNLSQPESPESTFAALPEDDHGQAETATFMTDCRKAPVIGLALCQAQALQSGGKWIIRLKVTRL